MIKRDVDGFIIDSRKYTNGEPTCTKKYWRRMVPQVNWTWMTSLCEYQMPSLRIKNPIHHSEIKRTIYVTLKAIVQLLDYIDRIDDFVVRWERNKMFQRTPLVGVWIQYFAQGH